MKRLFSLSLLFTALCTAFAACGGAVSDSGSAVPNGAGAAGAGSGATGGANEKGGSGGTAGGAAGAPAGNAGMNVGGEGGWGTAGTAGSHAGSGGSGVGGGGGSINAGAGGEGAGAGGEGGAGAGGDGGAGAGGAGAGGAGGLAGSGGAACGDTSNDPKNCGACGHDCLGPTCTGGVCQPLDIVTLPVGTHHPFAIAVNATHVYFTSDGTPEASGIFAAPIDGGAWIPILPGQDAGTVLALDASRVYFAAGGEIASVPLAGGMPKSLAKSAGKPSGIAIDATHVYFPGGKVTLDGSAMATMGAPEMGALDVAVDATNVYSVGYFNVKETPIAGGPTTQLGTVGFYNYTRIAVDAVNVYWSDPTKIWRAPIAGGAMETVVTMKANVLAVAARDGYVYFTTSDGAVLRTAGDGSSPPLTLAASQEYPARIALDASYIYWTNQAGGTIRRVAR